MQRVLCAWIPALVPAQAAPPKDAPRLEHVTVLETAAPGAEIVSVQASSRRAALTHSDSGQVEILELADPARPRSVRVVSLGLQPGEMLTSVALPPAGDWLLAVVVAKDDMAPGRALVHSVVDGSLLATFPTGVGPDCVDIDPAGRRALIANEAEGCDQKKGELVSAPGSLTLIELDADPT